jgi:undecaprenyl-diphosphatase
MDFLEIISLLSLIITQSITEFFPVSSSGHLIIYSLILQENYQIALDSLSFHVLLHLGSAVAVIIYFYKDWKDMLSDSLDDFIKFKFKFKLWSNDGMLLIKIAVATIPAVIIGFFFYDFFVGYVRNITVVALSLFIGAIYLFLAERYNKKMNLHTIENVGFKEYIILGIIQALAFIPGLSRSGMIFSTALILKIDRLLSIKIAFLMSCPVIIGATIHELVFNYQLIIIDSYLLSLTSFTLSFLTSLIALRLIFKYVKNHSFFIFVVYRLLLSVLLIFFI